MKKLILFLSTIFINISYCAQQNEPTGSKRKPELVIENRAQKRQKTEKEIDEIENIKRLFPELHKLNDNRSIHLQIEKIKNKFKQSGADVNMQFNNAFTPLTNISYNKNFNELAFWLISNGADLNKTPKRGAPSLFYAAAESNLELMEFLINNGAIVNFKKDGFPTILEAALFHSQANMIIEPAIKLLLINGTNFNDEQFQNMLNRNDKREYKRIFEQIIKEIVNEYRKKINDRNNAIIAQLDTALSEKQKHANIMAIFKEYLIPNYTDEQIMDNIMQIRYDLGELSEIQRTKFEEQIRQSQQARPADIAMHPAQQAAASTDIAPMQQ